MGKGVRQAFDKNILTLPIASIVVQQDITPALRDRAAYKQITASMKEVGLIQPLIVFPHTSDKYLLLDGHLRLDVIRQLGWPTVECIAATDDEAYTYNKRVNHLPPVAAHYMLLKALSKGLTEQRLAAALNVDVGVIRRDRTLLDGICPETIDILKDKHVARTVFALLRKMKPFRQIEAAEHMVASAKYTGTFAKALLAMTPPDLLVDPPADQKAKSKIDESQALLQQETASIVRDLKDAEASYGTDILALTVACGYLSRLLGNHRIEKYLAKHHPEILQTVRGVLSEMKPNAAQAVAAS